MTCDAGSRKGASTAIEAVLILVVLMSVAIGITAFLAQQGDRAENEISFQLLSTVNASCSTGQVTWWVENSGQNPAFFDQEPIIISESGAVNTTLSSGTVTGTMTIGPGEREPLTATTPKPFKRGTVYTLEMSDGFTTRCSTEMPWFDSNWDYRRKIEFTPSTLGPDGVTTVTVDTQKLVDSGKLNADCQDVKVVSDGTVLNVSIYRPTGSCATSSETNITFEVPNPSTGQYTTYLYYGNPGDTALDRERFVGDPKLDILYIADTSASFIPIWEDLQSDIAPIENTLQSDGIDVDSQLWMINNTYVDYHAGDNRVCDVGQTLNSPLYCVENYPVDSITQMKPFLTDYLLPSSYPPSPPQTWLDYDPDVAPYLDAVSEGWGFTFWDVFDRDPWRADSIKVIVFLYDSDSTGGGRFGTGTCDDPLGFDLVNDAKPILESREITVFGMLPDGVDCGNDNSPALSGTNRIAYRQMDTVGTVVPYDNQGEVTDKIENTLIDFVNNDPDFVTGPESTFGPEESLGLVG